MNAAVLFVGALFGSAYTAAWWLAVTHVSSHPTPWNLIAIPVALGTIASVFLFVRVLMDAYDGGGG